MKENEEFKPKPEVDITNNLVDFLFLILTRILPITCIALGIWQLTLSNYVDGVFLIVLGIGVVYTTIEANNLEP